MSGHFVDLAHLAGCSDEELALWVEQADFGRFVAGRDLAPLRERLLRLEREQGLTQLHRRVSEKVLSEGTRLVETPRYAGKRRAFALSPSGRHLAIAGDRDETSQLGGAVHLWELASGFVVDTVECEGNVGGYGEGSKLQWSPSGSWLGVNLGIAVGVMRAFAGTAPSFTVDVTRRWGSPPPWSVKNPEHAVDLGHMPAWCWAPDEQSLFISTRGPDHARGCIVPFRERAAIREESEGVRWCPARWAGTHSRNHPLTWVRWSPDGARVFGHGKHSVDWWEPPVQGDEVAYDFVSVTDVQSGDLQFASKDLKFPLAFSPDGSLLAHATERLVLADGRTGRTVAELGEQLAPCRPRVESFTWSQDGRRLAVVSNLGHHPDDGDPRRPPLGHEHPAVFIFDEGRFRYVLRMESYWFADSRRPDLHGWAWSPDGSQAACKVDERRIRGWALADEPRRLWELESVGRIEGLVWAADETLVVLEEEGVAFWDVSTGHLRARHSFATEPGRVPPPASWNPSPDGRAQGLPTKDGWTFTRVLEDGTVVCPPEVRGQLASRLMFAVDGRHAWPWRWAVGTRHTRLEEGLARPASRATGDVAPFAEHRVPVPEGETAGQREARHEKWGPLERYAYPTLPVSHYRADPVFIQGPDLCLEHLAPYVGQAMLVCEYLGSVRHFTATLLEVSSEGLLLHCGERGRRVVDEPRAFDSILWMGPAVPLRES
ncbi:WD40 repeat domain-containing protein [Myxococcus sp. K15C18031901]|uniref:WD40 repeat domain-containing protein n=1 Tax=Myxococcus dinghuensis TaxID=2906761 RepID=UPI0020A70228|nr:WD40 repeat domain-containing protein [Myxococcus dinghuensis]MCP3097908.1 WD40 repeat domain-containing protein [Myxococcus dinghuensis]